MTMRCFSWVWAIAFSILVAPISIQAQTLQQAADPLTDRQVIERVSGSIDRGLNYLRAQQLSDGGWQRNSAVNGLATLAILGRGHVPGRGPFRDVLEKSKSALLRAQRADGYVSYSTMYEHGLATLALAELYGMDPDPKVEAALRKAVDLIVKSQNPEGGWRYNPAPHDADLSVSVMQIVALRAANNAEVPVPEAVIKKAIAYVKKCFKEGRFGYQPQGERTPQTTAAGILSLQLLGEPNDPMIKEGLANLTKVPVAWQANEVRYFYYFHYYAIQAMHQAGGKEWNDWRPKIRELLLEKQNPDGSWDVPPGTAENAGSVGQNKAYWTAMACLVLEIDMHYLPAYQR